MLRFDPALVESDPDAELDPALAAIDPNSPTAVADLIAALQEQVGKKGRVAGRSV